MTRPIVMVMGAAVAVGLGGGTLAAKGGAWENVQAQARALVARARAAEWPAAAEAARRLEAEVAAQAPLEIADIQVLGSPPQGLGMYTPLFKGEVRGEELYIYAQVRHHGLREVHGHHELHLVSGLEILTDQGASLAKDDNFGESRFSARAPHRDTFVVIALRTKGMEPGTYRARLTLEDRIAHKEVTGEVRFTVPGTAN